MVELKMSQNRNNTILILKILILNILCIMVAVVAAFESGLLKHRIYSQTKCWLKISNCHTNSVVQAPSPSTNNSSNVVIQKTDIVPTKISYDQLGINLDIIPHSFNPKINSWDIDSHQANIMNESAKLFPINNKGQTFIYGHNTNNTFYFVNLLQIGDTINLFDADNHQYHFKVYALETLPPNRSDILKYNDEYRLTLMTCTSFNDANRKLVYLKPILDS